MKTILIPIFDGTIAKNLLRTDVLPVLKEGGARIVLIPPKGRADYYRSQFADGDKVIIDDSQFWQHDRLEFVISEIFLHSIPTVFMKIRQSDWYWNEGQYLKYFGARVLSNLGKFKIWRTFLRKFETFLKPPKYIKDVYDKWQPDLVFAPTMIPRDEIELMKLAKKDGKVTVGMVKSWDNPTSKLFLRIFPDWIISHNEIVARELNEIHDYPKEKIFISGIPQFDEYTDPNFIESREKFFKKIGADPDKKLILYAPAGDWMNPNDKETVKILMDWINEGKKNMQVLLRLHPAYESATEQLEGTPNLIIERPGKHFGGLKAYEFDDSDVRHLASSIYHSDLVINTASTMAIEGAIFDKPVILIGFDGDKRLRYWHSVVRYYDREHFVPIVKSGGEKLVKSKEEFLKAVEDYLKNPVLDKDGRRRIVKEQCFKLDGESGKRIGEFLLAEI